MYTAFSDLLPKDHPYIRVHNEFWKTFGGANVVLISVEVTDGDIFNPAVLEKVKKLTEIIERTPGANNYQIFSIARQKVKDVRATAWGIEVQPVMWPDVPQSPEEIERSTQYRLRQSHHRRTTSVGGWQSGANHRGFPRRAARLRGALFQRIQQAIKEVEDAKTRIFAAGEPILYGWIYHHLRQIGLIIALTCLSILALLVLYYRNLNGVMIPVLSAVITFIWGTGFTALMGYNFEPLILVVPFLIAARTISHSIQFRERFFEELERFGDKEKAAIESAAGLMMPGSVSIVTDAIGLTVLLVAPDADSYQAGHCGKLLGAQQSRDRGHSRSDPLLLLSGAAPAAARRRRSLARSPAATAWAAFVFIHWAGWSSSPVSPWIVVWSALLVSVFDGRRFASRLAATVARLEYNQSVRHINDKISGHRSSLRYRQGPGGKHDEVAAGAGDGSKPFNVTCCARPMSAELIRWWT